MYIMVFSALDLFMTHVYKKLSVTLGYDFWKYNWNIWCQCPSHIRYTYSKGLHLFITYTLKIESHTIQSRDTLRCAAVLTWPWRIHGALANFIIAKSGDLQQWNESAITDYALANFYSIFGHWICFEIRTVAWYRSATPFLFNVATE